MDELLAKGYQLGILTARSSEDIVYKGLKDNWFRHGFTYTAHPISCAVSSASLDVYVKDLKEKDECCVITINIPNTDNIIPGIINNFTLRLIINNDNITVRLGQR